MNPACSEARKRLSEYIDDKLSAIERGEVDRHVGSCGECKKELALMAEARSLMRQSPRVSPPERFYRDVLRKIESPEPAERPVFWSYLPTKTLAAVCAMALVFIVTREVKKKDPAAHSITDQTQPVPVESPAEKEIALQPAPAAPKVEEKTPAPREAPFVGERSAARQETKSKTDPADLRGASVEDVGPLPERRAEDIATAPVPEPPSAMLDAFQSASKAGSQSFSGRAQKRSSMSAPRQREAGGLGSAPQAPSAAVTDLEAAMETGSATLAVLREWKGTSSGVRDRRMVAIKDPDTWQRLWIEHTLNQRPALSLPDVDFSQQMVVAVFSGEQLSGRLTIHITERRLSSAALIVFFSETKSTGAPQTGRTQPFHIQLIPRADRAISFQKNQ